MDIKDLIHSFEQNLNVSLRLIALARTKVELGAWYGLKGGRGKYTEGEG